VLRGHDDDVYRAHFSADERFVATSSLDGTVRVWQVDQPGARSYAVGDPVESLAVVGGRALVKTASTVASWDLATGARTVAFAWGTDHNLGLGHVSPDGQNLVVPHADWSMEVRHRDGTTVQLKGHCDVINYLAFSTDGKRVYTASNDGTLRRWELATGAGSVLYQSSKPIRGFALAPDGQVAALVGDTAFMIQPDGASRLLGTGPDWCIIFAQFEPVAPRAGGDHRLVLQRCDHRLAILAGREVVELATGGYAAAKVAFSPDGARAAGAMGDRTVRIWEVATGKLLQVLRGHADLVMDVAFSPDGAELASASHDNTVRVWDLASGDYRVLRGHAQAVEHVVWSDRAHLVTGSRDGTLRLWDAPAVRPPSASEIAGALAAATTARIDGDRPTTATR
jgi:WD40 repeat protein